MTDYEPVSFRPAPLPDIHVFRRVRRKARAPYRTPSAIAASLAGTVLLLWSTSGLWSASRPPPPPDVGQEDPTHLGWLATPSRALNERTLTESTTSPGQQDCKQKDVLRPLCKPVNTCNNSCDCFENATKDNTTSHETTPKWHADLLTFTLEDRKAGAIALHVICIFFVFSGLAIVCDNYFEPALGQISDALGLAPDVATATFIAAGGSAPELSTSVLGTFVTGDDIGIGTIIGSAVFNALFVIAVCALVSDNLPLSWWPLARDAVFYNFSIFLATVFIFDGKIYWWESAILICVYGLYVLLMKHNQKLVKWTEK